MQPCKQCGNTRLWLQLNNGSKRCLQCGASQDPERPNQRASPRFRAIWPLMLASAILTTTMIAIRPGLNTNKSTQIPFNTDDRPGHHTKPQPSRSTIPESLFTDLDKGDTALLPRREQLPDGSTRYHYKRKDGQGDFSIEELEYLANNPPDHSTRQEDIKRLLNKLDQLGVSVLIEQTHDPKAAGTWSPSSSSVRIKPEIISQGTEDFHEVLSHESVHVAQSCANGSIRSQPIALNISLKYSPSIDNSIASPLYHGGSGKQLTIEREAYSHSLEEGAALRLLNYYCRQNR